MNSTIYQFLFIYLILLLKGQIAEGGCPYSACEWWSLCAWQFVNAKYLLDVYKIIFRHSRWWIACKLSLFFDDYVMWMYVHLCHPCTFGVSESGFKASRSAAVRWSETASFFPLLVFKCWNQLSPKHWRSCRGQQLLRGLRVMDTCRWWALLAQRAPSPARAAVPLGLPFLWSARGLQPLARNRDLQLCSWVLSGGWEGDENTPKTVINTIWRILSALCISESGDQDTK